MIRTSSSERSGADETPLARLSRPPDNRWPDGALHHGSRVLLLVVLALAITFLFPPGSGPTMSRYEIGMVSDEDVIASVTFGVPKNLEELERERSAGAAAVPPTFRRHPAAADSMAAAVEGFFERVEDAGGADEPGPALGQILSGLGLAVTPPQRDLLTDPETRGLVEDGALRAVRELLPQGVLDEAARLEPATAGRVLVVDPEGRERYVQGDSVLTSRAFYQAASRFLPAEGGSDVNELLRLTLIRFMSPTLRYDAAATEQDRDAARRAVPTTKSTVLQGEAVVRANQQVGETELERLRAYEEALRARGQLEDRGLRLAAFGAAGLLNLLILGVFGVLIFFYRSDIYGNFRWLLLQGVLILTFAGAGGIIARNLLPPELLPIAFVALAVAVLWDGRLALLLAATLAALIGAQGPFQSAGAWLPVFVAGAAAALSVRAVRRRAQTWIFIAIIVAAYVVVLSAIGVLAARDAERIGSSIAWASGNAVVSAILAMGFLPVFEWFTRITTDQTLLEWADPNRPLLKRLSMEAPGTYAHAINVANLAEAAANAIGANGLLSRVGVYYHDVGKMVKPQYFIENQPAGRNPHDKLKAITSASIVREHVTEGVRLAEEAKLPDVLIDFIPEHHGTQEISFFYERAKQESEEGEALDPASFRYPGPRPQSRETAIVMLADSVESAARTLQDPTPDRMKGLIDSIVASKIEQRQLDEAPLTLRELGIIKAQFQKVLGGTYHHRIDYPSTRHLTEAAPGTPPPPDTGAFEGVEVAEDEPAPSSAGEPVPSPGDRQESEAPDPDPDRPAS